MKITDMQFKRKFSLNFCKNLILPMAEMTFTSDFYDGDRGDLYPLLESTGGGEDIGHGVYHHKGASGEAHTRFFSSFFPYATYEMKLLPKSSGTVGFNYFAEGAFAAVRFSAGDGGVDITFEDSVGRQSDYAAYDPDGSLTPVISLRPGAFEVYLRREWGIQYVCTFKSAEFDQSNRETFFRAAGVALYAEGEASVAGVRAYMDSGLGLADMRSIRFENGDVFVSSDGKMYFTASIRRRSGTHQGVFSWVPSTAKFELVGVLFFDSGDGVWADDVATSLIFNRQNCKWHLHVASFNHGHIIGSAVFKDDVRFGVNVVDIDLMKEATATDGSEDDLFLGKMGDEDPDLIYDEVRKKWLFSVCRKYTATKKYMYFFFESDYPDRGFEIVGHGLAGEETGGTIMRIRGEMYFICGNSRKLRSDYRIYKWGEFDRFDTMSFDYPDGGFRGWGTLLPIKAGTRERIYHLTFDRVRTSPDYEWSYGNVYLFEGESRKI